MESFFVNVFIFREQVTEEFPFVITIPESTFIRETWRTVLTFWRLNVF
jgi:hypothetical protein